MSDDLSEHILIVDDDVQLRRMLRRFLEDEGFSVSEAADAEGTHRTLNSRKVDLITLDLGLGRADGLSIARDIRQKSDIPIVMLTGKGDTIDRIVGLEIGADDYIPKPFHLREVLARIRSVLRRRGGGGTTRDTERHGETIEFDAFVLDVARRTLQGPEGPVVLTSGEFDLLAMFANHPHRVLTRDQIMDLLKGHDWSPLDRSIDNQVARLRKKIEADPAAPQLLKTVRGAGYCFTPRRLS